MEASGGGGGGGVESAVRVKSWWLETAVGERRQRFTVELRPEETTIVSWKKLLLNDTTATTNNNKVNVGTTSSPCPPSNTHPKLLHFTIAPGQAAENEVKDAPPASRFSAVVKKIEHLYMGKHSSDEEDLNDVPDDDEYDTEDSFIDDAELDDYFWVDNSAIKHDGFFVNRGKLECIEPTLLPYLQPKKRRRKDLAEGHGRADGHVLSKHFKLGKKAAGKSVPLVGENSATQSHSTGIPNERCEDVRFQDQMKASETSKKKPVDTKTILDPSSLRTSNGGTILEDKDLDKKTILLPSENHRNKLKAGSEMSDTSKEMLIEKSSSVHCKSQSGRLPNNVDDTDQSAQRREKIGIHERPDVNVPERKQCTQTVKATLRQRKEGSSVGPKTTMLEKTIAELEKMVSESRLPTMEVPDTDVSSQAVKRRLPSDIKQKLAKVARLAQESHGTISQQLINRLMSIVGHWVQLRTLKRNLKVMVNMGLMANQEKDDRFQQLKKEVVEMIKVRVPLMKSKAHEQQAGASDDYKEIDANEKDVLKRKCCMDDALEDNICGLYDLYVDGLEEDTGPQVRKLYAELAELWPSGFMDNYGIKRAICRATDRRKALHSQHKNMEKISRKKMLIQKTEETFQVEDYSITQPQYMQEKLATDSIILGLTSLEQPVSNAVAENTVLRMLATDMNGACIGWPTREMVKGSSSNSNDTRTDALTKKKVKRKSEVELSEAPFRPDKSTSVQEEENPESNKLVAGPLQQTNVQSATPPNFEQKS